MSPLADDDRGERAQGRRVAVADGIAARAGFLGHLEPQPVPARQRRRDRRRRRRACRASQARRARVPGDAGWSTHGKLDGHAKNPGHCPLDMRAQRRGRRVNLQHAMYGHQTSLPADEVRLPQRPHRPQAPCRPAHAAAHSIVPYRRRRHQHSARRRCACRLRRTRHRWPPHDVISGVEWDSGAAPARWRPRRPRRRRAAVRRRDVRRPARPSRGGTRRQRAAGARASPPGGAAAGYAESARLGPGPAVDLADQGRAGRAAACAYTAAPPALAPARAHPGRRGGAAGAGVGARLPGGGGYWRSERRLRARMGGRVGLREHVPDGEVHWPDERRPVRLGRRVLGDRGRADPEDRQPDRGHHAGTPGQDRRLRLPGGRGRRTGRPPRHARVHLPVLRRAGRADRGRARAALGSAGARIEIRPLPPGAAMPAPAAAGRRHRPAAPGHRGAARDRRWQPVAARAAAGRPRCCWSPRPRAGRRGRAGSLVARAAPRSPGCAGWPPARLYRAAAWCLPMLVVWLAATAVAARSGAPCAAAPYLAWLAMWHRAARRYPAAAAVIAPAAIPAGLAAGGLAWSCRLRSMAAGQRRPRPGLGGRLRPAAVAAPGAQRAGADRRARRGAADHRGGGLRGRRRHQGGRPPGRPIAGIPYAGCARTRS